MPNGGEMPEGGKMPDMSQMPEGGEMPDMSQMPEGEEMPDMPQMPEGGEMPDMSQVPENGKNSADGESTEGATGKNDSAREASESRENDNSGNRGDRGNRNGNFAMTESTEQEIITLTDEDLTNILAGDVGASEGTISYSTRSSIEGGELEEATTYTIAGVQSNYAQISNLTMAVGEFLTEEANNNKEKSCVLGANIAAEIFGSAIDAYGSILYIDQRIYVVDGVLESMGSVSSGISPDDAVFIPYQTGIKYLVGENADPTITIIADDVEHLDTVITATTELLAEYYPNTEFTYEDAGSKMEAASASNEILTMLLIAMAVIVFIVGGIGIMNVMFVSVKERTNEIGILKAIGCSQKNILLEFLLEAGAISFIGGVLGMLLSLGITPLVRYFDVRVELSLAAFGAALAFAVCTGVIFGFYPAYRASKLVPVEALSAE
ncbi:MAG: ABC transporter permease [Lachnospiraceae bacterium]|nr:ABC transporter permease [Lachnospiraceae bacterium]